uniref:Zinc finger (Ran-binding) family protein n=1 Tax=Solanum tuberosum TaxID=4113 RepID=M1A4A4_SOLTU
MQRHSQNMSSNFGQSLTNVAKDHSSYSRLRISSQQKIVRHSFLVLQVSGYGNGNNIFLPLDVTLAIKRCL